MNKFTFLIAVSIFLALAINSLWPYRAFEEQLIRVQAKQELGGTIHTLEDESIEIQSVLLDYSENRELVLKTQLAMIKYPDKTRKLLLLFGVEEDFEEVLLKYGEVVIPVINYFMTTDIKQTIKLMDKTGKLLNDFKNWWNGEEADVADKELGPEQQAWYAIQFIKTGGHDFLGQFVIRDQGEVQWIQTERITEGLSSFFTSGVRGLEAHYITDQEITVNDLIWAGVDVLAVAGTLKLLRAGRQAARTGKSIGVTRQTTLYGSRLLKRGFAGQLLKYSTVAATAWVVIKHPSLLTSLFAKVGQLFGIPPMLAQMMGIALLAFIFLYPTFWFLKLFIRPLSMMVKFLIMILKNLEQRLLSYKPTRID